MTIDMEHTTFYQKQEDDKNLIGGSTSFWHLSNV